MNAEPIARLAEPIARLVCRCAPDCEERINCQTVGTVGHMACGWCEAHGTARHLCLCLVIAAEVTA